MFAREGHRTVGDRLHNDTAARRQSVVPGERGCAGKDRLGRGCVLRADRCSSSADNERNVKGRVSGDKGSDCRNRSNSTSTGSGNAQTMIVSSAATRRHTCHTGAFTHPVYVTSLTNVLLSLPRHTAGASESSKSFGQRPLLAVLCGLRFRAAGASLVWSSSIATV